MSVSTDRLATRVDIALQGVRMDAPVRRPDGAGPSDDGHVLVDGVNAALPRNPDSPYRLREGRIFLRRRLSWPRSRRQRSGWTVSGRW
ncbi:MAG: hypothetical protein ACRDRX_23500 [Pseudonocardiaceae bacterium]